MSSKDDVWQSEPTVIKPTPGRGRAHKDADQGKDSATALFTALEGSEPAAPIDFRSSGMPFLVAAARPQLNLLDRLRSMPDVADPERLRMAAVEEMRAYERKVANAGVDVEHARIAHYVLCATIDDVVLATPWGAASEWGSNSLVSTFHRDVQGGERVFDLLSHLHKDPGRNRDVLMLLYLCLSLGFRGRLRVSSRGALELSQYRDSLYRTLQRSMGDIERELSPNWRGVNARDAKRGFRHLLSALLGLVLLAAALGYIGFLGLINSDSDRLIVAVAELPPVGIPSIKVEQPIVVPPPAVDPMADFLRFLKPEVDRGVLTTSRNGNEVLVRFRNTGFFARGNADISPSFKSLLDNIGKSIAEARFDVQVIGHTDSEPIRSNVRFQSNWHLSMERAKAVADILRLYVPADRIRYDGRGETEPIDTNDTATGREANRRTEILVRYARDTDPNVVIEGAGQKP